MSPMKPKAKTGEPDFEETLSLTQLARRWRTSRKAIRRLLGRQVLGFVQIRGTFRIPREEVERYEHEREEPGS